MGLSLSVLLAQHNQVMVSYQMRREKGIPTSWCTPYGYQLNQQGNKFEATEDAKWVKLIYQWYLAGVSTNEIARRLEFLEVARPNERLNRKLHEGDDPTYNKWHPSTVLRILNSSALVMGRRKKIDVNTTSVRTLPEDKWIIAENAHEAIVTKDEYYQAQKVTKNNGNRCSAYVPEHHEAIVSPEIARAAHLVASSSKKCGVQDIVVIWQGALKGFVGIHPNWNGINAESIRSLCLNAYLPEEVMKLNDIAEMRAGATLGKALQSEYLTVSGTCFINQSSPVMTVSKNGIRFSKACHTRLDDCEYVELLLHRKIL